MLQQDSYIEQSSLEDIKTLLTYCVRGERFCDGHWGSRNEADYICRILIRLADLAQTIFGK